MKLAHALFMETVTHTPPWRTCRSAMSSVAGNSSFSHGSARRPLNTCALLAIAIRAIAFHFGMDHTSILYFVKIELSAEPPPHSECFLDFLNRRSAIISDARAGQRFITGHREAAE